MSGHSDQSGIVSAGPGPAVLAVDVGGTDLKAALLLSTGELSPVLRRPTPRDPAAPASAIVYAVAALAAEFRHDGPAFGAIGLTVPGIVDEEAGVGIASTNLGWRDFSFRALLARESALPVALAHDVRAAGAAEHRLGAARGASDAAVVTIGTGVAAAIFVDGRPYRGRGYAGEIGHSVVVPGGRPCPCGHRGCLEAIGSARAIAERYRALSGVQPAGAADVVARATAGDPDAIRAWEEGLDALAIGFAQLSAVLAPELIVVGGGLSEAGDALLVPLRERLAELRSHGPQPQIVRARLGQDAGIWGAGLAARDVLRRAS